MRTWSRLFIAFIIVTASTAVAQFVEQTVTPIPLPRSSYNCGTWGDYDNDGRLDILQTNQDTTRIFRNMGGGRFKELTSAPLLGVSWGDADWGDYDNDGNLDILLTGSVQGPDSAVSKIYRNERGDPWTFKETSIPLMGIAKGSAKWGDYDNDGDLDILLTGDTSYVGPANFHKGVTRIYRNDGDDTFKEQTLVLPNLHSGVGGAWGDYDNDGDLDLVLAGRTDDDTRLSKIYRNDGGDPVIFTETPIGLIPANGGSVAWGDLDNDGDLDLLLTGDAAAPGRVKISSIYRNNQPAETFTEMFPTSLTGVSHSSVALGDYDSDGDLDIVLAGLNGTVANPAGGTGITKIYRNNGGLSFSEQMLFPAPINGVINGSVALGDYDNDGDLDILLSGLVNPPYTPFTSTTKLLRNESITAVNTMPNTLPSVPSTLTEAVNGNDVTFTWDQAYDNETAQRALRYNIVIGRTMDGVDKVSPMSDRRDGYRRIVSLGNTNHRTSWTIRAFNGGFSGRTYYWSVQSIDNAFAGSPFNYGQKFWVPGWFDTYWPGVLVTGLAIAVAVMFMARKKQSASHAK